MFLKSVQFNSAVQAIDGKPTLATGTRRIPSQENTNHTESHHNREK